jgi:hypothetical protein
MILDKNVTLSGSKASVTYSEDGSILFLRSVGVYLPDHMEVQSRRLQFEYLPP